MIPIVVPSGDDFRWVLRYSAPAFFLLVIWHCWSVWSALPLYRTLFASFGADLPLDTELALNYYWVGGLIVSVPSLLSATFLLLRPESPTKQQKAAYLVSLGALLSAFAWNGFTTSAMIKMVSILGKVV